MSKDLIKRLRLEAEHQIEWDSNPELVLEQAADRIEELEDENARLKDEVKMLQHAATISYQAGIYDAKLKGKADE